MKPLTVDIENFCGLGYRGSAKCVSNFDTLNRFISASLTIFSKETQIYIVYRNKTDLLLLLDKAIKRPNSLYSAFGNVLCNIYASGSTDIWLNPRTINDQGPKAHYILCGYGHQLKLLSVLPFSRSSS